MTDVPASTSATDISVSDVNFQGSGKPTLL
jgi:hypothetical protein